MASASALPLLLLDVDGVLCPIGPGPGEPMTTFELESGPLTFSERLPGRLARLDGRFELVWATSRKHDANQLARALGLPALAVIEFGGARARHGQTWKLSPVKRFVENRAVAWLDDEFARDAHAWADTRSHPTLLVDVNPAWGLVDAHVEILLTFAGALGGGRATGR